jgi:hypothetical protein
MTQKRSEETGISGGESANPRSGEVRSAEALASPANAGKAASGEAPAKKWKAGDRVCFAHLLTQSYTVLRTYIGGEPNVELVGMPGIFASHIFVEAPAESREALVPVSPKLPYSTPELTGPFELEPKLSEWLQHSRDSGSLHVALPIPAMDALIAELSRLRALVNTAIQSRTFDIAERAKGAYAAYGLSMGNKNFRGEQMPMWEELPEAIRSAWKAAV